MDNSTIAEKNLYNNFKYDLVAKLCNDHNTFKKPKVNVL